MFVSFSEQKLISKHISKLETGLLIRGFLRAEAKINAGFRGQKLVSLLVSFLEEGPGITIEARNRSAC